MDIQIEPVLRAGEDRDLGFVDDRMVFAPDLFGLRLTGGAFGDLPVAIHLLAREFADHQLRCLAEAGV
jgi:hypothetical protein